MSHNNNVAGSNYGSAQKKELTPLVILLVTVALVFIAFIVLTVAFVSLTLITEDFSNVEIVEEVSQPVLNYVDIPL